MKTIVITEDFDFDMLQNIFDAIDSEKENIDIILSNNGGIVSAADLLLKKMESVKDRITLYGVLIFSCGFTLFHDFTGKKILGRDAEGAIHLMGSEMIISKLLDGTNQIGSHNAVYRARFYKEKCITKDFSFLTEEERKDYWDGKDVVFLYERLTEIFPDCIDTRQPSIIP